MNRSGAELLGALAARLSSYRERGVRRVSLELSGEQVTFTLRDGHVQAVCTCGSDACEHQSLAARFFADELDAPAPSAQAPKLRSSLRPPAMHTADARALAEAIHELCLATARAGANSQYSPSIRAAIDQLIAAAPQPTSLSLARFIGRFQSALSLGEVGELARLLAGAQRWADQLFSGDASPESRARTRVWLGSSEGEAPASLTDVVLLELGREWLSGLARSAIERRYLVDVASGELYCEERRRGEQNISVGPCPRVVHVAFAELETALAPARVRLLQYTVTPEASEAHWQRLAELAVTDLSQLAARFAEATRTSPGLAEPALLFAPKSLSAGATGSLRDGDGDRLELWDDHGSSLADTVRELSANGELVWVLGRLKGVSRGLVLRPISLLVRTAAGYRLRRVT